MKQKLSDLETLRRQRLRCNTYDASWNSWNCKEAVPENLSFNQQERSAQQGEDQQERSAQGEDQAEISTQGEDLLARYTTWVSQERAQAAAELARIRMELAYEELCLQEARQESRKYAVNGERRSSAASRWHVERIEQLQRELSRKAAQDPDMFYVQKEEQLQEDMQEEHNGRLVNVPYLAQARSQIRHSLEAGIPVYLVGHLGSGKTQLALECAEDYMRDHLLQQKLHEAMEKFRQETCQDNGKTRDAELSYFSSIYPKILAEVQAADCHPYFIAGSHNLTAEDMFFEKTLRLTHAADSRSNKEELDSLINGYMSFLKENESRMQDMNQDQKLELMLAGWKTFSNLYVAQNSGYGTTVEKIEKEVLLALKEGRPLVIDEINTIAMANLIGLNDILQHHAGQLAYITGVGTVRIAEGFCLIGTGNLSTGTVSYEGTNVLNPAFQSRFTTIVYNYVPQNTDGALDVQEDPERNELFRLIIDHLCEVRELSRNDARDDHRNDGEDDSRNDVKGNGRSDGEDDNSNYVKNDSRNDSRENKNKSVSKESTLEVSLQLPQPAVTLQQLFSLAQLARVSQNIFEGRSSTINSNGDTPVLNEAVLSIRNLIHVLDHWNFGEEEDLSMALWNGFLSSVTNADDRNLLLALAVRYGFFPEQEGWHVEARGRGDAALTLDDIRTCPYQHQIQPLQKLSQEDVVYILHGSGPKRTKLPASLQAEIIIDEDAARNIPTAAQLDASIRDLEQTSRILSTVRK